MRLGTASTARRVRPCGAGAADSADTVEVALEQAWGYDTAEQGPTRVTACDQAGVAVSTADAGGGGDCGATTRWPGSPPCASSTPERSLAPGDVAVEYCVTDAVHVLAQDGTTTTRYTLDPAAPDSRECPRNEGRVSRACHLQHHFEPGRVCHLVDVLDLAGAP